MTPPAAVHGGQLDHKWGDIYKPFAARPYGDRAVWIGYDPSETGDSAGLVIVAPPLGEGGKFLILERHQFRGMDFAAQAEFIRKCMQRYWVTYIGIDTTGMGTGVAQLVKQFFPAVTTFSYSPEVKTRLLCKSSSQYHLQIKCPCCGTLNHLKAESLPLDRRERFDE